MAPAMDHDSTIKAHDENHFEIFPRAGHQAGNQRPRKPIVARRTGRTGRATRGGRARWPAQDDCDTGPFEYLMIVAAGIIPLALAIILPRVVYPTRPRTTTETAAALPVERAAPIRATNAEAPSPQAATLRPPAGAKAPDEAAVVVIPPALPRPDAIYRRGKQRRAKGDYIGAICDFDEVLRAKPDFAWCYYDRAGAYSLMGNQPAALADLDRALAIMPTEPKLWRAHAVVRHRMRELKEAVIDISLAAELTAGAGRDDGAPADLAKKSNQWLDELLEHATRLIRSRRYQAAVEELNEVIERRPDRPSARVRRAAAYYANGQFDKALDDLNVALRLRPRPAQAFKLRSVLHERRADYAAALADMRAAQRLDPGSREYIERIDELLLHWER